MISKDKVTELFFIIDEFFIEYSKVIKEHSLGNGNKKKRNRSFTMSDSEIMTIMVLFHYGSFRNLKHFYMGYVKMHMKEEFPKTVSYNRFVELQKKVAIPLGVFIKITCLGECTGVSIIDSTPLIVCHIKRERAHKVFKGLAQKGKSTIGWFYGFKVSGMSIFVVIN